MSPSSRFAVVMSAALALIAVANAHEDKPHVHGVVNMDIAVVDAQVNIDLEMPLDSVVGFEHAPRDDAQRKLASDALARLRDGAKLFRMDAAAQCALTQTEVKAPVLEQGTPANDGHGDADASYVFTCGQPAKLDKLEVLLFDAFSRIERIDVQAALPKRQGKFVLQRSANTLRLGS